MTFAMVSAKHYTMYYKRNYAITPRTIGGLMEDVFHNGWNRLNEEVNSFTAPVNIKETDNSYELNLVAPGLKKEDLKINIDKDTLNISFEQNQENKEEKEDGKWLRNEYRMRSFKRSFNLNEKVDAGKISAKYADGVLAVTLPKKEISEPATHEISVN
jgi:HSP20 family protein